MQPDPPHHGKTEAAAARRFSIRVAVFYAAFFVVTGTQLPFFPLWLDAVAVPPAWIGAIIAVPVVARLLVMPFITRACERRGALRGGIVTLMFLTVAGFALVGSLRDPVLILLAMALTSCVYTPVLPMTDGYALRGIAHHRVSYGPIRLWGSAAFIAGALLAGFMSGVIAAQHLIWVIVSVAAVAAMASLLLEPVVSTNKPVDRQDRAVWLTPAFLSLMAATALIQGSHIAYYTFSSITWRNLGFDGAMISVLWGLGVIAEIVLFAISPRLRLRPATLLAIGGSAAILRWILIAQNPPVALLAVVQLMHGLTFGATHLGAIGLLTRLVPVHVTATAQGYLTAAVSLTSATASLLCGMIYAQVGETIYYGMSAMGLAGSVVLALAWHRLR
jgi:MFS transporter, PPP family, 3-phenylpropionic acid transporter